MNTTTSNYNSEIKPWRELVLDHRKNDTPSCKFLSIWRTSETPLNTKFKNTCQQIVFYSKKIKMILSDIRMYGDTIKQEYGRFKITQLYQQLYMLFILGIPSRYYRVYLLFKKDRWNLIKEFTYDNIEPEKFLIKNSLYEREDVYERENDIFKNKFEFYTHCLKNEISTPPILSVIKFNEKSILENEYLDLPKEDIFIKTIDGTRGVGSSKFTYSKDGYKDELGALYNLESLINLLSNRKLNDNHYRREFIVQPALQNHKDWKQFTSGAMATCRILSIQNLENDIIPIAATLRMPTGNMIADNFSMGGIASPINIKTGELGKAISSKPKNGFFEFDIHPDTKQIINGTILPQWTELLNFTTKVHKSFEFISVAWDISYTTTGFVVVEGNGLWDIDVIESPQNFPLSNTQYPQLYDNWIKFLNK